MDTPTYYDNVCNEALDLQKQMNLTDVQTLLYNHICRGDFYLRNEDGQHFYDINNEGFGYFGERAWVKRQFSKLVNAGLVKFESLRDCRSKQCTSWVWYLPKFNYNDLVDACCYVTTHNLAMIKDRFNLPDGFSKVGKYGDLELIKNNEGYTFKYKGEESIYSWDYDGKGIKEDLTDITGQPTWESAQYYDSFSEMSHDIISFMVNDGYKLKNVKGYTQKRRFKI